MSVAAARTFITAAKATQEHFKQQYQPFYVKFITQKQVPTQHDIDALADIITEMQAVAKVYHADVPAAMGTFGGPSDTVIRNELILLKTMKEKMAAAAHH